MRDEAVRADSVETLVCVQCGRSHATAARRAAIRLQAHLPTWQVAELWPCYYDGYRSDEAIARMLQRDLAAVRDGHTPRGEELRDGGGVGYP